jgi:RNA polymerase-binding transcription factor
MADDAVVIRLQEERARVADRIEALTRDFDEIVEASQLVSADDEHDPDGATIAFERAQVAALLRAARQELVEADQALDRHRAGSYGRCEGCGRPIGSERLDAVPTARTCVDCAR